MKKFLQIAASVAILGGVLLVAPSTASAATPKYDLFVSKSGSTNAGNGVSCKMADYDNLQEALDNAYSGDKIYICAGVYKPTDELNDSFVVYDDIELIGAGANRTFIDGDCTGDSTMYMYYNYDDLTVRNLTFRNGCADDDYYYDGGAIWMNYEGDLHCYNSTFTNNVAADEGGAIHNYYGSVYAEKCTFTNNVSYANDSYSSGGAVFASYVETKNSVFLNNHGDGSGGAVAARYVAIFDNTTFTSNTSDSNGGAVYAHVPVYGHFESRNSKYIGNTSGLGNTYGGAVDIYAGDSTFFGGSFINNVAGCAGGAISTEFTDPWTTNVRQVLFSGNSASSSCGGDAIYAPFVNLDRATIKGNYGSGDTLWVCDYEDKKSRWGSDQDVAAGC